ncbi:MAG: ATP-binding cassette domain-containing protein [Dorea sp.]|nr:ATP-binding cassette domain-containing protein [Dorea sp.]
MKEIELKAVNKFYKPDVVALEDFSLTVEEGEFVFITGRSGSGKSTFLKLLSGQIFPTSGEMWVRGNDVSALTKEQIPYYRRQFGIMQSDLGLLKERTARQNIELAMRATEQPLELTKRRVEHTMRALGIYERAEHYPRELSGGEAARVLLARALVTDPKILVLDEPTANLDSSAAWDLMCLIDEINRKGITVLVASHNRELVTIMKKRVVTLAAGVKVADEKNVIYSSTAGDIFDERRVLREREERRRKQRGR